MFARWRNALLLALTLCMGFSDVAHAQGTMSDEWIRKAGEIAEIDLRERSFTLDTRSGEQIQVRVSDNTRFRSPEGIVEALEDLEIGMKVLVTGTFDAQGVLNADLVVVRPPREQPDRFHILGEVGRVDLEAQTFELQPRDGDPVTIHVDERTHFRSRDGALQELEDLEAGMTALVLAVGAEADTLLARVVAAADLEDVPEGLIHQRGEITRVVPGKRTFTLETLEGESLVLQTVERTRFEGRGVQVDGLDDIEPGMMAAVAALEGECGEFEARYVLVWEQGEFFDRPEVDLRAAGRISELGHESFTLQRRNGEQLVLQVGDETVFRSQGGIVEAFEDLEVGMPVVVAADEVEDGNYLVRWVAIGKPPIGDLSGGSGSRPEPPMRHPQQPG